MIELPKRFVKFYFPEALLFFIRVFANTISYVEEDLALGLMVKLFFVPLFHDSTIVGRALSIGFRTVRIIMGLFAYTLVAVSISTLALIWFSAPFLVFFPEIFPYSGYVFLSSLVFALALFIDLQTKNPGKQLWQIKSSKDLPQAARIKPKDLSFAALLTSHEIKDLLATLEIENLEIHEIPLMPEILDKAYSLAKDSNAKYITPAYFFVAKLMFMPGSENMLMKVDRKLDDFAGALNFLEHTRNTWRKVFLWDRDFAVRHLKGVNRGWLSAPTPFLDSVSTDLTKQAAKFGFPRFLGRETVVAEVINVLSQERDRNVLLVGQPGAGKTTLVDFLATVIIAGNAPGALATKRLVRLDFGKLISGVSTEGEFAERLKKIFDEVEFVQDVILFIDEIHNLGIADAGKNLNVFALLTPYLESDKFQFIASTEGEHYVKVLEKNGEIARIFRKIELPGASLDETVKILQDRAIDLARNEKITMTFMAIRALAYFAAKLVHDKVLPDSALTLLEECQTLSKDRLITSKLVKEVLERYVNVPVVEVDSKQKGLLLNLEDLIHEGLIDQEEAVKSVADTLRRGAVDLRDEKRPIGSFLFVGPTGVGKTELSKILAEKYFKTKGAFIRFDMSEYQGEDGIRRLIGGGDETGELTEAVKRKPYALILLDEFEKADEEVLNLFLQVLEDGRLTDSTGNVTDFTNTIIIATSNAGSLLVAESLKNKERPVILEEKVKQELLKVFKPELINRFDKIVIFKPLLYAQLQQIVVLKLKALSTLLKSQGFLVEFTQEVITELARRGFDPVLGARPLRRLIQDTIEARLSVMILEEKLPKGRKFIVDKAIFDATILK